MTVIPTPAQEGVGSFSISILTTEMKFTLILCDSDAYRPGRSSGTRMRKTLMWQGNAEEFCPAVQTLMS